MPPMICKNALTIFPKQPNKSTGAARPPLLNNLVCLIVIHTTFATMEYSLRIYKNEYGVRHLNFIRKTFTVSGETEKVLTIIGEEVELEKVMSAMFLTDEQFKAIFPDFQTEKECAEWTRKQLADLKDNIAKTLCRIINDGDTNNPLFAKFRSFYLNELTK